MRIAYRTVRAGFAAAIATGEGAHTMEDMRGFIEGGLVDVIQVDLMHFGGFLAMKKLAGWADVAAPQRTGLGVRPNHEECARHPRTRAHIRMFAEGRDKRA